MCKKNGVVFNKYKSNGNDITNLTTSLNMIK